MTKNLKNLALICALATSALAFCAPAQAQEYGHRHDHSRYDWSEGRHRRDHGYRYGGDYRHDQRNYRHYGNGYQDHHDRGYYDGRRENR